MISIFHVILLITQIRFFELSILFQEPLYLDKCIVCCETDLEDYFEIQELSSKETFIFKVFNLILNTNRDNMNFNLKIIY